MWWRSGCGRRVSRRPARQQVGAGLEQVEGCLSAMLALVPRHEVRRSLRIFGVAADREGIFDQCGVGSRGNENRVLSADCSRKRLVIPHIHPQRLLMAVMPAIESRSVTSDGPQWDRSRRGRRARLVFWLVRDVCADSKPIEVLHQRGLVIEVLDQAALPRGGEVERRDQGGKTGGCVCDVAHADVGAAQAVMRRGSLAPPARAFRRLPPPCRYVSRRFHAGLARRAPTA